MSPGQAIRTLQADLGLTPVDLQMILGTTPRHIERWGANQAYPQTKARYRLAELMELHRHLITMFTAWEGARAWLAAPSRYLAGVSPLEVLRAGRLDRAREALTALDAGVYL
ncbi:MAG: antitoxin Xre/MbcA/ParS toxin-binding domain-containing protein [Chloroflexota bacterium]